MKNITVHDKLFQLFISNEHISSAVKKIANDINNDFKNKEPLFIVVLNGAFIFAADLFKLLNINCSVSFVKYTSYKGVQSTQSINRLIGLNEDIEDKDIIIIEDIIDTGYSMNELIKDLKIKKPAQIKIATMLFKPEAFRFNYKIDYIGIEIPNEFIVGYGLDYDGKGRNYKDIYRILNF